MAFTCIPYSRINSAMDFKIMDFIYRLYYDEAGMPIRITVNEEVPGRFIRINKAMYDRPEYTRLRVVNGKLTRATDNPDQMLLQKCKISSYKSAKNHAGILINSGEGQYYGFENH